MDLIPGVCLTWCPLAEPSGSVSPEDETLASCVVGECGLLTVQDLQGDLEGSDSMGTDF